MDKSEGYLLRALGSDLYFELTIMLVASLRFHRDIRPITLLTDNPKHELLETYPYLFDGIIDVTPFKEELFKNYIFNDREKDRLITDLLLHLSPYGRTIMLDSDMLIVKPTGELWNISQNYNFTVLGCDPMYPGWGEMSDYDIKVVSEDIMEDLGLTSPVRIREVHAGILWFDKSDVTQRVIETLKAAFMPGMMDKYFPKVYKMWKCQNNEMALVYAMSLLDLPVIPYNKNIMSVNPKYFSVMESRADMGDFIQGKVYQLEGNMKFVDSVPTVVHLFKKANDPNFWRNRKELYEWLDVMMPGANLNFMG